MLKLSFDSKGYDMKNPRFGLLDLTILDSSELRSLNTFALTAAVKERESKYRPLIVVNYFFLFFFLTLQPKIWNKNQIKEKP